MKTYKNEIINAIIKASESDKIISLKEIANANGVNHISTNEVLQIVASVAKQLDNYRPVQMVDPKNTNESLFTTLHFVENDVEFAETV